MLRYLKRKFKQKYSRKYRSQHKYLRSDGGTLLVLLFLLSRSHAHALTVNQLTQAMVTAQQGLISNGMVSSPRDIAVTGLYQTLVAGVTAVGTHMPLLPPGTTPIPLPGLVTHIPLVHNYYDITICASCILKDCLTFFKKFIQFKTSKKFFLDILKAADWKGLNEGSNPKN